MVATRPDTSAGTMPTPARRKTWQSTPLGWDALADRVALGRALGQRVAARIRDERPAGAICASADVTAWLPELVADEIVAGRVVDEAAWLARRASIADDAFFVSPDPLGKRTDRYHGKPPLRRAHAADDVIHIVDAPLPDDAADAIVNWSRTALVSMSFVARGDAPEAELSADDLERLAQQVVAGVVDVYDGNGFAWFDFEQGARP